MTGDGPRRAKGVGIAVRPPAQRERLEPGFAHEPSGARTSKGTARTEARATGCGNPGTPADCGPAGGTTPRSGTPRSITPDSTSPGGPTPGSTPVDTTTPDTTTPDTATPDTATPDSPTPTSSTTADEAADDAARTIDTGTEAGPRAGAEARLAALSAMAKNDPRREGLRRDVIEEHLPLVHHLARRFIGRGEPYDDLVQVGTIGLMHAVDRFDPQRGSFAGYAVPTIVGEIRRHFRDRGWALRIPRRIQDLGRQVAEAREQLTHRLDRSPTVSEIAGHLRVEADLVLEALDTAGAYVTVPLPSTADETDRLQKVTPDTDLEQVEQREMLRPLMARLPEREQKILQLRFVKGMSQSQIAGEVGVSQMHVSRLLAKSLSTLRTGLTEES